MNAILISSTGDVIVTDVKKNMKVSINRQVPGFVRIKTRHDSLKFARNNPVLLEERYLSHQGPSRKTLSIDVDIIKAVRLVKHINEGYEKEKKDLEGIFENISNALALIEKHNKKCGQCEQDLEEAQSLIKNVLIKIKRTRAFYKVLSKFKIENAINHIEDAQNAENDFEMNMHLKPASSILYAAKRRLEKRLDNIGPINSYNIDREMYLRGIRDYYIWGKMIRLAKQLHSLPQDTVNAYKSDVYLYNNIMELCKIAVQDSLQFKSALTEVGQSVKESGRNPYGLKELRRAYVLGVRESKMDDALEHLHEAAVLIGLDKPFYIAAQLKETNDDYTPVLIEQLCDVDLELLTDNPKAALSHLRWVLSFYEDIFQGKAKKPEPYISI